MMALADAAVGLGSMIEHCLIGHLRRRPKGRTAGGGTGGHASDVAIPQVRFPPIVKNSNFRFGHSSHGHACRVTTIPCTVFWLLGSMGNT
jgi:hypothetical protein